jgi:hypothetical protein
VVITPNLDVSRLREIAKRRLAAAIELDDPWEKAFALIQIAPTFRTDDPTRAIANGEEALRLARQLANPNALTYAPMILANLIAHTNPGRAETLLEEAISIASSLANHFAEHFGQQDLGRVRALRGDHLKAAYAYLGSAELANRVGDHLFTVQAVGGIACSLAELGDHEPALLLATWAERQGLPLDWADPTTRLPFVTSPTLARLQAQMSLVRRRQLQDQAESIDDAAAIALGRARVEALHQT